MSDTLCYEKWPILFWSLTCFKGSNVSDDDDTVSVTVNETTVTVSIPSIKYLESFNGESGGKACNAESEITSSKTADGKFQLECTPKPGFEPATWTAREQ